MCNVWEPWQLGLGGVAFHAWVLQGDAIVRVFWRCRQDVFSKFVSAKLWFQCNVSQNLEKKISMSGHFHAMAYIPPDCIQLYSNPQYYQVFILIFYMHGLYTPPPHQPHFSCSQCTCNFFNRAGLNNHVCSKNPGNHYTSNLNLHSAMAIHLLSSWVPLRSTLSQGELRLKSPMMTFFNYLILTTTATMIPPIILMTLKITHLITTPNKKLIEY